MKYCINYNKRIQTDCQIDEYTIEFKKSEPNLLQFLDENTDKRIILYAKEEQDLLLFKDLCKKYNNLVIKFEYYDKTIIEEIVELGFPFFYNIHVNNWDLLLGLIDLGVTDVYVVEDLCFQLDKVAEIAHAENVQLRVFPNVAQSVWGDTAPLKKFFIRPEDVNIYGQYVDVFEIYGENKNVIAVTLKVYQKDKKWFGRLNEIIIGLGDPNLDSRFITPLFAEKRVTCDKRCVKGGKCRICDRIQDLAKTLEEANIYIDFKEEEGEK